MIENTASVSAAELLDAKIQHVLITPQLSLQERSFLLQLYLLCLFRAAKNPPGKNRLLACILKREEEAGEQKDDFQALVWRIKMIDQRPQVEAVERG